MESPALSWLGYGGAAERQEPAAPAAVPDAATFEAVMREYNQRLYRLALGLVGDPAEAEDVLQDSYVRAFEKRATFAGRSGLGAWLASIVRNQSIDHLRARQARKSAYLLESELSGSIGGLDSPIDDVPSERRDDIPETGIGREELRQALEAAILALPAPFRGVFVLREVEGLSLLQTSIYLGIPIATVKTRAHRARLLMRSRLGREFAANSLRPFEFLAERCNRIVTRVLERLGTR